MRDVEVAELVNGIRLERLMERLHRLAQIGGSAQNGVTWLAFTEEDRRARKQVLDWMGQAGLDTRVSPIEGDTGSPADVAESGTARLKQDKEGGMLPQFDLLMPRTLPEALELLAERGAEVTPLAGGTGLLVDMRGGACHPGVLMDVGRLRELRGVRQEDGHVVVGGGVTIAELLDDPLIARQGAVLREAAAVFANPLVRNRATVGGNLAYASPAADSAPPLLVLGAEVELVSQAGSRHVPLEDFVTGVRQTVRRPDELLAAVRWPVPAPQSAGAFRKLALRKAGAISVVSAAVTVERAADGRCGQARIALGAVAPTPIRAHAAEDLLGGQPLTPDAIAEAARLAGEATCCVDDVRGSAAYRRRVTEVLVRRLLAQGVRSRE